MNRKARIEALVNAGVHPDDAEDAVDAVDRDRPADSNIESWTYGTEQMMAMGTVSDDDVIDALAEWMEAERVPEEFKRILTAKTVTD